MNVLNIGSFKSIRETRQKFNNKQCSDSYLKQVVNLKQVARLKQELLDQYNLSDKEFERKLENDKFFRYACAFSCSISSSRQGSKDEKHVIEMLSKHLKISYKNFNMFQAKINDFVPIKITGEVLKRKKAKELGFGKSDTLKSFDFHGKIKNKDFLGFAKICTDDGGHQDNVFEEAINLIEWLNVHAKEDMYYFLLLDFEQNKLTTRTQVELKPKILKNNVFLCNHTEFQKIVEDLYEK